MISQYVMQNREYYHQAYAPILHGRIPENHRLTARFPTGPNPSNEVKGDEARQSSKAAPVTLQNVIDRLGANADLADTRKRDLRSAIVIYGKILGQAPQAIPMDLAAMRKTLDGVVPLQAKVSRKRWANLRSDIAAAIAASGLQPMLKTSDIEPDRHWDQLLAAAKDRRISNGLSRLARWATLRQITPKEVNDAVLARFFSELETGSLVRNLRFQRRNLPSFGISSRRYCRERICAVLRSQRRALPGNGFRGSSFQPR
jgi:hypothetical protein